MQSKKKNLLQYILTPDRGGTEKEGSIQLKDLIAKKEGGEKLGLITC